MGYWSPSFWVQQVERGEAPSTCTYLDYAFTDDFNQVQKEIIKKEQFHQQNAKARLRKSSSSLSKSRPTTVNLGVGESEYRSSFARDGFGKSLLETVSSNYSVSNDGNTTSLNEFLKPSHSAPSLMSGTHNVPIS